MASFFVGIPALIRSAHAAAWLTAPPNEWLRAMAVTVSGTAFGSDISPPSRALTP